MGRYLNAYQMLSDVREGINEFSTGLLQGTDTTGAFSNTTLMRYINEAQMFLYNLTFVKKPEDYLTSQTITPVASVVTLPSNFFKIARLEYSSDGSKIHRMGHLDQKHQSNSLGSKFLYRFQGRSSIYIDQDSMTDPVVLWYYWKPRMIHMGQAQSGSGASALKMATTSIARDDYYNGMLVEDITAGFASTITDFVASTLVATVTGTASTSDWYGLVPEAPEEFHSLIIKKAILLAKSDVKSPTPASPKEIAEFNELLAMTLQAYYGFASEDVPVEEIFMDLGGYY